MKFKLDENFGTRTQQIFESQGHDIKTVLNQNFKDVRTKSFMKSVVKKNGVW